MASLGKTDVELLDLINKAIPISEADVTVTKMYTEANTSFVKPEPQETPPGEKITFNQNESEITVEQFTAIDMVDGIAQSINKSENIVEQFETVEMFNGTAPKINESENISNNARRSYGTVELIIKTEDSLTCTQSVSTDNSMELNEEDLNVLTKEQLIEKLCNSRQEMESVKKQLSKSERQVEKSNDYNEVLRKMLEQLSSQLHTYKTGTYIEAASQVDTSDLYNYTIGEPCMPDWGQSATLDDTDPLMPAQYSDSVEPDELKVAEATSMSIADSLKMAAQDVIDKQAKDAMLLQGYVYDENYGLYYHTQSGYYYDSEKMLYYDPNSGTYYYYDYDTGQYAFHSQVSLTEGNAFTTYRDTTTPTKKEKPSKPQQKKKGVSHKQKKGHHNASIQDFKNRRERRNALRCLKEEGRKRRIERKKLEKDCTNRDSEGSRRQKKRKSKSPIRSSSAENIDSRSEFFSDDESRRKRKRKRKLSDNSKERYLEKSTIHHKKSSKKQKRKKKKDKKSKKMKKDKKSKKKAKNDKADKVEIIKYLDDSDKKIGNLVNQEVCGALDKDQAVLVSESDEGEVVEHIHMEIDLDINDQTKANDTLSPGSCSTSNRDTVSENSADSQPEIGTKKKIESKVDSRSTKLRQDRHDSPIKVKTDSKFSCDSSSSSESGEISDSSQSTDSFVSESEELTDSEDEVYLIHDYDDDEEEECVEDIGQSWPPCVRVIVTESDCVAVGMLYIVTFQGTTIGRGKDRGICIPDINISKYHADMQFNDSLGVFTILDKGSQNGTFLNEERISQPKKQSEPKDFTHGDMIEIGSTKLLCHIHSGTDTCDECEPGIVMAKHREQLPKQEVKFISKEERKKLQKKELNEIKKRYGLKNAAYEDQPGLFNNPNYEDKAAERRKTVGSDMPGSKREAPASVHRPISSENKGHKMLAKMGWKEGESLGKDNSGIQEPISVNLRVNQSAGLGSGGAGMFSADDANSTDIKKATRRIQAMHRYTQLQKTEERTNPTNSNTINKTEETKSSLEKSTEKYKMEWSKGSTEFT